MASSSSEPGSGLKAEGEPSEPAVGCVNMIMGNPTTTTATTTTATNDQLLLYGGGVLKKKFKKERGCTAKERISKMPPCAAGKRSSIYRGVTRHRWTGRYEAHLWDKSTWNQNQNKKGKQVYLGAYDDEEAAARAYDLAALKYWGPGTLINFPVSDYSRDLDEMQNVSREDYLASLRRKSSGFSRGIAKYRGLSRPSQSSRWETSFSQMGGPDYADLGTTESEFPGGFCIDRKVDLTSYIKWWGTNKSKHGGFDDVGCGDLKTLEWGFQPTEPYQMPCLGVSQGHSGKKKHQEVASALSILSRSAAYLSLQEKASKEKNNEKNNNENKNKEIEFSAGIPVESTSGHDGGGDGGGGDESLLMGGATTLGMNWLPFQRTGSLSPLTSSFLSAPLMTSYNTIDPLADTVLWTSLVSHPTSGPSLSNTKVTKTESGSTYTGFHPEQ